MLWHCLCPSSFMERAGGIVTSQEMSGTKAEEGSMISKMKSEAKPNVEKVCLGLDERDMHAWEARIQIYPPLRGCVYDFWQLPRNLDWYASRQPRRAQGSATIQMRWDVQGATATCTIWSISAIEGWRMQFSGSWTLCALQLGTCFWISWKVNQDE